MDVMTRNTDTQIPRKTCLLYFFFLKLVVDLRASQHVIVTFEFNTEFWLYIDCIANCT